MPLEDGGGYSPSGEEFVAVKVEDEFLKERRESVPDEVSEAPGTAVFGGKPMFVDELTDVE